MNLLFMNLFACFARTREIFWGRFIIPPMLRVVVIASVVYGHSGLPFLAYGYLLAEFITVVVFGGLILRELRRQQLLQVHEVDGLRRRDQRRGIRLIQPFIPANGVRVHRLGSRWRGRHRLPVHGLGKWRSRRLPLVELAGSFLGSGP